MKELSLVLALGILPVASFASDDTTVSNSFEEPVPNCVTVESSCGYNNVICYTSIQDLVNQTMDMDEALCP